MPFRDFPVDAIKNIRKDFNFTTHKCSCVFYNYTNAKVHSPLNTGMRISNLPYNKQRNVKTHTSNSDSNDKQTGKENDKENVTGNGKTENVRGNIEALTASASNLQINLIVPTTTTTTTQVSPTETKYVNPDETTTFKPTIASVQSNKNVDKSNTYVMPTRSNALSERRNRLGNVHSTKKPILHSPLFAAVPSTTSTTTPVTTYSTNREKKTQNRLGNAGTRRPFIIFHSHKYKQGTTTTAATPPV